MKNNSCFSEPNKDLNGTIGLGISNVVQENSEFDVILILILIRNKGV